MHIYLPLHLRKDGELHLLHDIAPAVAVRLHMDLPVVGALSGIARWVHLVRHELEVLECDDFLLRPEFLEEEQVVEGIRHDDVEVLIAGLGEAEGMGRAGFLPLF
jgi:hypothetical protein